MDYNRFDKRMPTGVWTDLHGFLTEADFACLSWGDPCQCRVNELALAHSENISLMSRGNRARITFGVYEEIANSQ